MNSAMAATAAGNRWRGICPVAEKMYRIWTQWVDLWLNARNKEVHRKKIMIVNDGFNFLIRKVVLEESFDSIGLQTSIGVWNVSEPPPYESTICKKMQVLSLSSTKR